MFLIRTRACVFARTFARVFILVFAAATWWYSHTLKEIRRFPFPPQRNNRTSRNKFLIAFGFRPMQDHTSFDEEFGEFFDTEDDAVFADKIKRRSTPRSSR